MLEIQTPSVPIKQGSRQIIEEKKVSTIFVIDSRIEVISLSTLVNESILSDKYY